jgi:heme-degrading monooxygenase HmoA
MGAGLWGKEEHIVFARVTSFEGPPEQVDEMTLHAGEQVFPALREMDGFSGVIGLADRHSGRLVSVTLWETEEVMRASEEATNRLRENSAQATGETIADVERYEVIFGEFEGTQL